MKISAAGQLIGGLICAGAVVLISGPTQAQSLFIGYEGGINGGTIAEITPDGVQSTFATGLDLPAGLAFDNSGNLFDGDAPVGSANQIYKFTPQGVQSTFATEVGFPQGMAFGSTGDLFVSAFEDRFVPPPYLPPGSIYEFTTSGTVSTFATRMGPGPLAFDSAGNLFAGQTGVITKITPGGVTNTFASGFDAGGLAFDGAGNLFASDYQFGHIYKFTPDGTKTTFASGLSTPTALAFNSAGDLFVAEFYSGEIIRITPGGVQSTFASGFTWAAALAFQPVPELGATVVGGSFQLTVSMPSPYYSTIVQASTDLINWVNVYTNTPPFSFTDSTAITGSRFYRALLGP